MNPILQMKRLRFCREGKHLEEATLRLGIGPGVTTRVYSLSPAVILLKQLFPFYYAHEGRNMFGPALEIHCGFAFLNRE